MTEFSARSLELFNQLKSAEGDKAGIEKDLRALAEHIKNNRAKTRCRSWPSRSKIA